MKVLIGELIVFAISVILLAGCRTTQDDSEDDDSIAAMIACVVPLHTEPTTQATSDDTGAIPQRAPTLLYFGAEWCNACQQERSELDALKENGWQIQEVDVDKESDLTNKYDIRTIPAWVYLNQRGEVIRKNIGYLDRWQVGEFVKGVSEAPPKREAPRRMVPG